MKQPLILASTSSARRALMHALRVPYEVEAPGVDEAVEDGTAAKDAVVILAERKARAVAARHPEALVLGADQLVEAGGRVLGKPESREQAREQLSLIAGRTHALWTGVCLVGPGVDRVEVDRVEMTVYPLAPAELERYLDLEEWRGCAGAYRIEGAGQALFERVDGDRTSVQGLPMQRVVRLLRAAGVEFFSPTA